MTENLERSFAAQRGRIDTQLFSLFASKPLHRSLRSSVRLELTDLAARVEREQASISERATPLAPLDPLAVHTRLVEGLPGEALFISAALAFDTLTDALPYFDVTRKTAWQKLEHTLTKAESEQALRLGRVATVAAHLLGSQEAGRQYLRTANFALGGVTPLELLKTSEGEQLVLNELQAHQEGGPL